MVEFTIVNPVPFGKATVTPPAGGLMTVPLGRTNEPPLGIVRRVPFGGVTIVPEGSETAAPTPPPDNVTVPFTTEAPENVSDDAVGREAKPGAAVEPALETAIVVPAGREITIALPSEAAGAPVGED